MRARIWIDALTPKQGRLAACLCLALRERGYEVLVTCREYECTRSTIELYGIEPLAVGEHGGGSRLGKLVADVRRMGSLTEIVRSFEPQVLIAYPNPSAARVAYGLGIKYVALNDTPHAEAANTLALPLCDVLIASECLRGAFDKYLLPRTHVLYYRGVDEVLWVRRFTPTRGALESLGLEERGYVVVRPEELKAAYYSWRGWGWLELCEELRARGLEVVVLPRYREQRAEAVKRGYVVPPACVDGLDLAYHARAVITGGGTMAREAALLGVPSYYTFPLRLRVSEYVSELGFPLYHWRGGPRELAEEIAERGPGELEEALRRARELVNRLESPEHVVLRVLERIVQARGGA